MQTSRFFRVLYTFQYLNYWKFKQVFPRQRNSYARNCLKPLIPNFCTSSVNKTKDQCVKDLLKEFPQPKNTLHRVVNEAYLIWHNVNIKPSVTIKQITCDSKEKLWHVTIAMKWPEVFHVEGVAPRKAEAEKIAYVYACQKIKEFGNLNDKNLPIFKKAPVLSPSRQVRSAKCDLSNIFQVIWSRYGSRELLPSFESEQVTGLSGSSPIWKSEVTLKYPEIKSFVGQSARLSDAEGIACVKALQWLVERGVINQKRRPILHSKDEEKRILEARKAPYMLSIPNELQSEMEEVLKISARFKDAFQNFNEVESAAVSIDKLDDVVETSSEIQDDEDLQSTEVQDIFSDKSLFYLNEQETAARNKQMYEQQQLLRKQSSLQETFPISAKRQDILKLIEENQVVVISGETGCGKTTQVPQFVLDSFIESYNGSNCNIVVTQPRRISAISIAEYVALQRGEKVGMTVGYQVRLNKQFPEDKGAIMFCTTGILLRKLCYNPDLEGVSHIFMDEVHERNIQIDFLLILLKRLLERNKQIKLILMSASFNTHLFSSYFGNCPTIHIPGFIYPVKEYFLEDVANEVNYCESVEEYSRLDLNLIAKVITLIDKSQPPGAILCFLPGWHEIKSVYSSLPDSFHDINKYVICLLHSRLIPEEQKLVFVKPNMGVRKIILATNVAETSITINDVVYVIDAGFHKETSFDSDKGTASLGVQWVTKANVRQRRGRAGRTRPGVCYHVFPRKVFSKMDEYPIPEVLRMPLEKVVLDCKLYCPNDKAEDLLSLALQPPTTDSIQQGIKELQVLGILNEDESLTSLGKTVVKFSSHPRLSKALVLSTFLRCLDPVLTISALLTMSQEPFLGMMEAKAQQKNIKHRFDNSRYSDHLALYDIFCQWNGLEDDESRAEFVENNLLDSDSLTVIKQLKNLFAENLREAKLVGGDSFFNKDSVYNENSEHLPVVLAALASAFYPNVIKLSQGEVLRGKLNKDKIIYSTVRGQKALIQNTSVASKEYSLPSPWLIYFSAMESEARRLMMTSLVSSVPGVCFVLFSGQQIFPQTGESNKVVLSVDNSEKLRFVCSKEDAQVLTEWRQLLDDLFNIYLQLPEQNNSRDFMEYLNVFTKCVLPILSDVLTISKKPFGSSFSKEETFEQEQDVQS